MEASWLNGEFLKTSERLILAPADGKFRPHEPVAHGSDVAREELIGFIDGLSLSSPVQSLFHGRFMGFLALAGERVRERQPVAWLRVAPEFE